LQTKKTGAQNVNAKPITDFASQFGVKIALNLDLMIEKNGRFYLVNAVLKPLIRQDFFYAGVYLGKTKGRKFFPSFNLLAKLSKKDANRVVVDGKAAWLFICGRDILGKSILRVYGSGKKDTNTLVLNEFGECLGFGRIVEKLTRLVGDNNFAVRNVSDIGDFLRRER
jgi:ribosome biogenesis protein Nip4